MVGLTSCTGLFDSIYDDPDQNAVPTDVVDNQSGDSTSVTAVTGQLYIEANSWTDWFYIDLQALADTATRQQAIEQAHYPYPIPTDLTTGSDDGTTGIYTYWFDVWGKGISVNEYRAFTPTDAQPAPPSWSVAVHRNNVRTNGGAVAETQLTDISLLDMRPAELEKLHFTADEWTENVVWAEQSQMLNSLIGSQGIAVNRVLSSWLQIEVPPMPPAFTHNNHVFVLRMADDSYAALQLADYLSPSGTKCCLTIKWRMMMQ